jgi:hypothetical protein
VREPGFPYPVVEPDQQGEAANKNDVKDNISDADVFFNKKQVEIDPQCHIQYQPE